MFYTGSKNNLNLTVNINGNFNKADIGCINNYGNNAEMLKVLPKVLPRVIHVFQWRLLQGFYLCSKIHIK